jgi:hypothetical protein
MDAARPANKRDARAPAETPRRMGKHDHLHIFFHPDYDRRLWLQTRSADPAHDTTALAQALAGSLARPFGTAGIPPVGNYTPP